MKYLIPVALLCLGCQETPKPAVAGPLQTVPIVKPEVVIEEPKPEPPKFDHLLGVAQTTVKRTEDRNREHNVQLAAMKFNGLVLQPGEEFSFNDRVGIRSGERGFKKAPVIWDGVLVDGMGGGACQVSSTLHSAILPAGLIATERHAHSRPSSYIDIGVDAAVSWPEVCEGACFKMDLKFENTYPFPIQLAVNYDIPLPGDTDNGDVLQISIYGTQPSHLKVDFDLSWHEADDFIVVEREKSWGSRRVQLQQGKRGRNAVCRITTTNKATGEITKRSLHSHYKPVNEVWETGPDYVPPPTEESHEP